MGFPFTVIQPEVDPTTGAWLMTSVWTPVGILFLYFGVSLVLLPTVMKGREPLEMANFITVYNFLILLGNCLLAAYVCFTLFMGLHFMMSIKDGYWYISVLLLRINGKVQPIVPAS